MNKKILFTATPTEKRAALLEHDKLVEVVVERPDQYRLVGNIYRGKVVSILPGIQSAFIDIGLEKCVFLHAGDVDPSLLLDSNDELIERYTNNDPSKRRKIIKVPIEKVLQKGQEILVQVIKEPISTKSAKVTTQISIAGRFLVLVPDANFIGVSKKASDFQKRRNLKKIISQLKPPGVGFIVRTIGTKVSESEFIQEIHHLIDQWNITQREALSGNGPKLIFKEHGIVTGVIRDLFSEEVSDVWVDDEDDFNEVQAYLRSIAPTLCDRVKLYRDKIPLFDKFNIEKELERSLKRKVWLKSGGYLIMDHTEALFAIDINTGRNTGKRNLEETLYTTNLEAVPEICRQLRLRDIGGLIVVDFIDMRNLKHRKHIEDEMRKLLAKDPTTPACTGLSKFGLMELTRKRVRPELQELYTDVCPACNGLGWVFSPETVTTRIDREMKRMESGRKGQIVTLSVHPSVAAYLLKDKGAIIKTLEDEHGMKLKVIENEELDPDEYEVALGNAKKTTFQNESRDDID
jgi:ribonuclease G